MFCASVIKVHSPRPARAIPSHVSTTLAFEHPMPSVKTRKGAEAEEFATALDTKAITFSGVLSVGYEESLKWEGGIEHDNKR